VRERLLCGNPIYVNTPIHRGDGKTPTSIKNPLYVNTRLQSGDGKTCRGCVVVASSIPWMNPGVNLKKTILTENTLYVNTRLQSGGEKSPESTQNRFNGFLTMKGRQCQSTPTLAS
jgi:hypothetical protein